jgi:hypothetical protein
LVVMMRVLSKLGGHAISTNGSGTISVEHGHKKLDRVQIECYSLHEDVAADSLGCNTYGSNHRSRALVAIR